MLASGRPTRDQLGQAVCDVDFNIYREGMDAYGEGAFNTYRESMAPFCFKKQTCFLNGLNL